MSTKKLWRVSEVCDRLSLKKTQVYELLKKGMLTRVYLPSPKETSKRKGIPRVLGESIDRYERGDVVAGPPDRNAGVRPRVDSKRRASPVARALGYQSFR